MSIVSIAPGARPARALVGEKVRTLWSTTSEAWRARKAAREMAELSDAALHDIGVTRAEIDTVVRNGRPARS